MNKTEFKAKFQALMQKAEDLREQGTVIGEIVEWLTEDPQYIVYNAGEYHKRLLISLAEKIKGEIE